MKVNTKIILIALIAMLLPTSFHASSVVDTNPPSWITIKYADLEQKSVSEYQLVTVTVSEKNMWWKDENHQVVLDYNRDYLKLVNVAYYNGSLSTISQDTREVSTNDSNFEVKYQFYLNPGYDIEDVPITITKLTDGVQTDQSTISISCKSQSAPKLVEFGEVKLNYSVQEYRNDGETVTFKAHFEVLENHSIAPLVLNLKQNNMKVSNEDDYTVDITSEEANIKMVDKVHYEIDAQENQQFDLTITAQVSALSSKNDRVEFFIFLENNEEFIRLEPTFFKSEKIKSNENTRALKYINIKLVIASFFMFLSLMYAISNIRKSRE